MTLLISNCQHVVKAPYITAIILMNFIPGLNTTDAIGNKGKENWKKP